ncbi:sugar phosphate isomerase/epimerase family protein [Tautonia sociabilis]|uniref:Sugar phosphate isomerase/epimerase n=1 Tax=Tautonia sociabilis TaxID=2080755 RepID=A0A432MKX6_9BACT|nr:sugar phosphate isomerase/epimerase family protein [Tautonia sociabilis]RUL88061.1 sugar phosphate isomerase/epimerase [Tautonia sociabilis]
MTDPIRSRRDFIRASLAGGAALGLGLGLRPGRLIAQEVSGSPAAGTIGDYKISLAQWSLHRRYFEDRDPAKVAQANLGFPRDAREEFGIEGVEFVNQFFKDRARDDSYLTELKRRADDQGVTCLLIMIDGEGSLSDADNSRRRQAVENHKKWVDAAKALGCHSIRVNTGDNYSASDVSVAVDGCAALAEYGKSQGINIICENHGGPSSDPDALIALIRGVGMDNFGTLPDFGNFATEGPRDEHRYAIDIYDAVARLMPFAKGVSAKCYDFQDGKELYLDFPRLMKIVTDSGYHGYVGIEYEGNRLSEPEGIKAAKALLDSLRGAEYSPKA